MSRITYSLTLSLLVVSLTSLSRAQEIIRQDDPPRVRVVPTPMKQELKNPVTAEYEKAFWERANEMIRSVTRNPDGSWAKMGINTYFENEKQSYPNQMFHILAGDVERGVKALQAEDNQAKGDNAHTLGIDFFPAFTLKGQMRKYFFFGNLLDPAYMARMKEAMAIWTKTDPRTTPHPIYQKFNPKIEGWQPNRFGNRQVDSRNTDNLRAMRDIAIYLFAEEAGNTATMEAAKKNIIFYVNSLYTIGMGEWDSDTYLCHSVAPYLCLYDFAKDPKMQQVGKAALDFFFTSAALKYDHGAFSGPEKRDYGNGYWELASPFAKFFSVYFGQNVKGAGANEYDAVHAITSNYRPAPAILALAQKDFPRPVEVLGTKPVYENWKDGARERPGFFETMYFGNTFQMGSVVSSGGDGDTGPFRLSAVNSKRGADVVNISSHKKLNEKFPGDQIGQYRNLIVWLRPADKETDFTFFLPTDAPRQTKDGVTFVKLENTWLALRPIQLADFKPAEMDAKFTKQYPDSILLSAAAANDAPFVGVAMEVGEAGMDFDEFVAKVSKDQKLDLSGIAEGKVRLTGIDGSFVEMKHSSDSDLPSLSRNGEMRDWNDPANFALWRTVGDRPLVSLGWKQGTLKVTAGGHTFESAFGPDGSSQFSNR